MAEPGCRYRDRNLAEQAVLTEPITDIWMSCIIIGIVCTFFEGAQNFFEKQNKIPGVEKYHIYLKVPHW